jgi:hypothetical protein
MSEDKPSGFQSMKSEMEVVRVCEPLPPPPVSGSEDELILMTSEFSQKSCPFCATKGLEVDYSSFGTDLYCADGCHGHFIFPCAPFEALEMWERNTQNTEVSQREADVETSQ